MPPVQGSLEFSIGNTQKELSTGEGAWWQQFERPVLDALIHQAIDGNLSLAQAYARVKQTQALTKQTRSDRLPQVNVDGEANTRFRGSDSIRGSSETGVALDWEIDVFDRVGSAVLANTWQEKASIENVEALKLTLAAEVANAYFGTIAAQQKLTLLHDQVKTDQELLALLELRYNNGVGTYVEVLQQQSRVADSKSLIPNAEALRMSFEHRLDVLLGKSPDNSSRVHHHETLDFAASLPPVGVPVDLLINRPDLRVAKAQLVASDAAIGEAIADRLPSISLDGSYVFSDTATFTGPVSLITSSFIQPLLDWGKRKAEVERNKALYEEALANFGQRYLEAIEEVENALTQEKSQREFLDRLEQRRKILNATVKETEARYRQGVDDYLPVLNALQELRTVERDLVDQRLVLVQTRIALYRATGGRVVRHQAGQEEAL